MRKHKVSLVAAQYRAGFIHLYRQLLLGALLLCSAAIALADPAGRVGRISLTEGDVWVRDSTQDESFAPDTNWPVTGGTLIETGVGGRAEVRIGSSIFRLAHGTVVQFDQLDDDTIRLRLDRGSVAARFKSGEQARESIIATPSGSVTFQDAGRYRVDSRGSGASLAVLQGSARIDAYRTASMVRTGTRLEWQADGRTQTSEVFADQFDDWVARLDRRDDSRAAPRYVSREMTGYDVLDEHGDWEVHTTYGAIWYPRVVVAGWAPYRHGRWVHLNPWGWTWVDAAPWGFPVSHYGRWAWVHGRWGWVPGAIVARPIWAPALVAWAGGSRWSVSINFGGPSYGWVALAPHEVYVPYYRCTPRYHHHLNVTHVINHTVINHYYQHPGSQAFANAQVPGAVSAAAVGAGFVRGTVPPGQANRGSHGNVIRAVTDARAAQDAFNQHRVTAPSLRGDATPVAISTQRPPASNAAAGAVPQSPISGRPLPAEAAALNASRPDMRRAPIAFDDNGREVGQGSMKRIQPAPEPTTQQAAPSRKLQHDNASAAAAAEAVRRAPPPPRSVERVEPVPQRVPEGFKRYMQQAQSQAQMQPHSLAQPPHGMKRAMPAQQAAAPRAARESREYRSHRDEGGRKSEPGNNRMADAVQRSLRVQ